MGEGRGDAHVPCLEKLGSHRQLLHPSVSHWVTWSVCKLHWEFHSIASDSTPVCLFLVLDVSLAVSTPLPAPIWVVVVLSQIFWKYVGCSYFFCSTTLTGVLWSSTMSYPQDIYLPFLWGGGCWDKMSYPQMEIWIKIKMRLNMNK